MNYLVCLFFCPKMGAVPTFPLIHLKKRKKFIKIPYYFCAKWKNTISNNKKRLDIQPYIKYNLLINYKIVT